MRNEDESTVTLTPIASKRSSEAIFEQLRSKIITGEVRPGERLPSERAMMDMLRRSRPTIREALRMLEYAGLVKIIPGCGGAVVVEPSNASVEQPLESMLTLKQLDKRELLEYRELNEVAAAGWAASRRTEEDIRHIQACLADLKRVRRNFALFAEADLSFHQAVAVAGHNRLTEIVDKVVHEMVLGLLSAAYKKKTAQQRTEMMEGILMAHTAIAEAIASGDADAAKREMREHIRMFETDIVSP